MFLGARTLPVDTNDFEQQHHNGVSFSPNQGKDTWDDDIDWDSVDFNTIPLVPQTSATQSLSLGITSVTGMKLGITNVSTNSSLPTKRTTATHPSPAQPSLQTSLSIRPASHFLSEKSSTPSFSSINYIADTLNPKPPSSTSFQSSASTSSSHSNSSSTHTSTPVSGLPPTDDEHTFVSGAPQIIPPEVLLKNASSMHPFDPTAISSWIYPTNMSVRDYQFNIVQKALFNNTLVSIPTGLGKTLIAAVVMYNYFRWFPEGKIVFLAPTRPLVVQQQEACYKIVGIPYEETSVFVGNSITPSERSLLWRKKRLFFATPQTFANDLIRGVVPGNSLVCLVIDEAHRATGNYAYVVCIREMLKFHKDFRVLALSATPGNTKERVEEVISNLLINRIEIRTEQSADVMPYTFKREKNSIVVQLQGFVKEAYQRFLEFLKPPLQRLYNAKAIRSNDPENLYPFLILDAQRRYNSIGGAASYSTAGDFGTLHKLCTLAQTLAVHSLRAFHAALIELPDAIKQGSLKPYRPLVALLQSPAYQQYMEWLTTQLSKTTRLASHPKQEELEKIILEHFQTNGSDSKVIIFAKFRAIVDEITLLLTKHHPLVRVTSFVGQARQKGGKLGLKQKEQIQIIKTFSESGINTLVSTSVGEEGLDIGDVDLIVCYDTSLSPIQMLQRMGRTGRKRSGRVICLLTAGKEENAYTKSQARHKGIQALIQDPRRKLELLPSAPRILPFHIKLVCIKMRMNIPTMPQKEQKEGASLNGSKAKSKLAGPFLSTTEMVQYISQFETHTPLPELDLSKFMDRQMDIKRYRIGPSITSKSFLCLLSSFQNLKSIDLASTQDDIKSMENAIDLLQLNNDASFFSSSSSSSSSSSFPDIQMDLNLSFSNKSPPLEELGLNATYSKLALDSSKLKKVPPEFLKLGMIDLNKKLSHLDNELTDIDFALEPGDEFDMPFFSFKESNTFSNSHHEYEVLKHNPWFPKALANFLKKSSIPTPEALRHAIQPILNVISNKMTKPTSSPRDFSFSQESLTTPLNLPSYPSSKPTSPHPLSHMKHSNPDVLPCREPSSSHFCDAVKNEEEKAHFPPSRFIALQSLSQRSSTESFGAEPVKTTSSNEVVLSSNTQQSVAAISQPPSSLHSLNSASSPASSPILTTSTKRRRGSDFMPKFHVNHFLQLEADHSGSSSGSESDASIGSLVEFLDDNPDLTPPTRPPIRAVSNIDIETPEFLRRYREIPKTPRTPSSSMDADHYDMDDSFLMGEETEIPVEGTQTLEALEEELERQRFNGRKQRKKRRIQGLKNAF